MLKKILRGVFPLMFVLIFLNDAFAKIKVVAAENMYGNIIATLGGDSVEVISVLQHPEQDPHLFSASPKLARDLAIADLIVSNGLGYDTWMEKLVKANHQEKNHVIVAALLHRKMGDNPHLWYDPDMLVSFATTISTILCEKSKSDCPQVVFRLNQLFEWHDKWIRDIQALKNSFKGHSVLATEPVVTLLTNAIGFRMQGVQLQLSVMNDTAPSARAIREAMDALTQQQVKILFYNTQVKNPLTEQLKQLALQHHVAMIGVSETMPPNMNYQEWMSSVINQIKMVGH